MARLRRLFRKNGRGRLQSGQSIILLAMAMIALLGFVGIVTDISLLFVRYSSLSRAVDAAAVAAAGQMRRVPDDEGDPFDVSDDVIGEAASVAQLNLAARQFIEVYGIDPTTVLVETCRVQRYRDDTGTPVDRDGTDLFLSDGSVNTAANPVDLMRYEQLCTDDELKLVRVTAQIDAPTAFLHLLGYTTVTLTVEAISQTAVLDVVLVFDVSEAMLNETQYADWQAAGYGYRYLPPHQNHIRLYADQTYSPPIPIEACWDWTFVVSQTQTQVMGGIDVVTPDYHPDVATMPSYHCPSSLYQPTAWLPTGLVAEVTPDSDLNTHREPPSVTCRVRVWPASDISRARIRRQWLVDEYIKDDGSDPAPFATEDDMQRWFLEHDTSTGDIFSPVASDELVDLAYIGFVPSFDYFACCNDPNSDWNFSDLVCQPFGEAREAAQGFLDRLDFLRGDRVAFVTYDRTATIIDPDGGGDQSPMIETQTNLLDPVTSVQVRRGADEVLNTVMGVRAETTFYQDTNLDGNWDCVVNGASCFTSLDQFMGQAIYNTVDQPVNTACPMDAAVLAPRFGGDYATYKYTGNPLDPLAPRSNSYADRDTLIDDVSTNDPLSMPNWVLSYVAGRPRNYAYEFRASCAGSNIGAALRQANNLLNDFGRREGAVWLMVMLSSGAAGASDPIGRFNVRGAAPATEPQLGNEANPFHIGNTYTSATHGTHQVYEPTPGDYGAFGLCPYGADPTSGGTPGELVRDVYYPFCLDIYPETRHFCGLENQATVPLLVALDNTLNTECEEYYDVDDYARDWADYLAVRNLQTGESRQDLIFPTVFTIGFGLNYDAIYDVDGNIAGYACGATDYNCQRGYDGDPQDFESQVRVVDFLAEELLRYIADVGDNQRIDNDYWQAFMPTRIGNGVVNPLAADAPWGPRGACEVPLDELGASTREDFRPLPPRVSCGNYFAAATASELTLVFNEIASRMFTRLAQ